MYPYPIVLVGFGPGLSEFDQAVAAVAGAVAGRCADFKSARAAARGLADKMPLFAVRLAGDADIELLDQVSSNFPGAPVMALVDGECDAATLYRISRAGAAQLVSIPATEQDLAGALQRITVQFGHVPALGRVVATCGATEGSGASGISINLAHVLASHWGVETVVAEPTVPVGRLASYFDCRAPRASQDLFFGPAAPSAAAVSKALTPVGERLRLLVSPRASLPSPPLSRERTLVVVEALRKLAQVVVLDMPYAFDDDYFELLSTADELVLVCAPTVQSIQGLQTLREALGRRGAAAEQRVVINRYVKAAEEFRPERLKGLLGVERLWTVADDPQGFADASVNGGPLGPHSPARADVERLAAAMFGNPPQKPPEHSHPSLFRRLFGRPER